MAFPSVLLESISTMETVQIVPTTFWTPLGSIQWKVVGLTYSVKILCLWNCTFTWLLNTVVVSKFTIINYTFFFIYSLITLQSISEEDKSIKEYAKKVHDYPEGVLYLNQEQIDRIIYAGERCVHTVEIPHQFISNNYSFHDLGSIELTETVCVGKLYYGNVASLNKKLLLEIKNLVSRV